VKLDETHQRLLDYARAHNVEVRFDSRGRNPDWKYGAFAVLWPASGGVAGKQSGWSGIELPTKQHSEKPEIYTNIVLAHELGHAMDYMERPWAYLDLGAYLKVERFEIAATPSQISGVYHGITPMSLMDIETRAWDIGLNLLQWAGFTAWDDFDNMRVHCLQGYIFHRQSFWDLVNPKLIELLRNT